MSICPKCGAENPEGSRYCNACGTSLQATSDVEYGVLLALCVTLGGLGVHSFYAGKRDIGIGQVVLGLFTCFIGSSIWALVDLIAIVQGSYVDGSGRVVTNK